MVSAEIRPRVKVMSFLDENLTDVIHTLNDDGPHRTHLQREHVAVFLGEMAERLVRDLVAPQKVEVPDDRPRKRSRGFSAPAALQEPDESHREHHQTEEQVAQIRNNNDCHR